MASLYRKPVVRTDPTTGQKIKGKSRKWWGQYKDAQGRLKRTPLAVDRMAAQAMLNQIVQRVEREKAGLVDPTEEQRKRPLTDHLREFEAYLRHRGVSDKQVAEKRSQLGKLVAEAKWHWIGDISAGGTVEFLGQLRRDGLSAQTYNHYLKAAKQFTRWLVRDRRTPTDPLVHLSRLNVRTDRRHDRRALSDEEFKRLVEAARRGKRVEGISGPDRAMLYVLAAWTGFRKGEIGSLTLRSLRLDDEPPTATVAACYSKHRREDTQVLHPELVRQLREWLATKEHLGARRAAVSDLGPRAGRHRAEDQQDDRAGPDGRPRQVARGSQDAQGAYPAAEVGLPVLLQPRRPVRRLPQHAAPVHHQSGAGGPVAQDGPDAGEAFGHSADVGRLHPHRLARLQRGDRVAAGAAGWRLRQRPGSRVPTAGSPWSQSQSDRSGAPPWHEGLRPSRAESQAERPCLSVVRASNRVDGDLPFLGSSFPPPFLAGMHFFVIAEDRDDHAVFGPLNRPIARIEERFLTPGESLD